MLKLPKIAEILKNREFIEVATADTANRPNAAPKFFLKLEDKFLYLVDYVRGHTLKNLKVNPRVSLSFMDQDTLTGYQVNGTVEIVNSGKEYSRLMDELSKKLISFSANRLIDGVRRGHKHREFETTFPESVLFFKVFVNGITEITPAGRLLRE
jgi:nitroimidazol reductase NimA-like FMN-containing flavoprotein (pyridoxamine 5'-phosphate oxidase superfamily)